MEPGARPLTRPALGRAAAVRARFRPRPGRGGVRRGRGGGPARTPAATLVHHDDDHDRAADPGGGGPAGLPAELGRLLPRAVWTLDPSGLDRTYVDDGLADIEVEIQQLASAHHRALVDVSHDFTVVLIGDTCASVTDRTVEASVAYDAATNVPAEPRTPHTRLFQMLLDKIDGQWKVVFSA